jgi:hypothetical protein
VIFILPNALELSMVETLIRFQLIDGEYFYTDEWGLPELYLEACDFSIDPSWPEFESVE